MFPTKLSNRRARRTSAQGPPQARVEPLPLEAAPLPLAVAPLPLVVAPLLLVAAVAAVTEALKGQSQLQVLSADGREIAAETGNQEVS